MAITEAQREVTVDILFDPSAPQGGDYWHGGAMITNLELFIAQALLYNYGELKILVMCRNDWFDPEFDYEVE